MKCLPLHGKIQCHDCFSCKSSEIDFNVTVREEQGWRITNNPLAWGSSKPRVIVLGFSKGPRQKEALLSIPHNDIAYKGSRGNVDKILSYLGLLNDGSNTDFSMQHKCEQLISNEHGQFHFGSLIRCTVERYDAKKQHWTASGGGMLDRFVQTDFGAEVAKNCTDKLISSIPDTTKLIVMFGLGSKLNYVQQAFKLFSSNRDENWVMLNDVAYSNGRLVVVHVEHFASQGSHIEDWLGIKDNPRQELGRLALKAVQIALQESEVENSMNLRP